MDNALVNRYMKLIEPLSFDLKLQLLDKIFESLKGHISSSENKEELLEELYGAWKDTDENLAEEILSSRSIIPGCI